MENNSEINKRHIAPTASIVLEDGTIIEMVFRPEQRRTLFAIYNAGRWTLQDGVDLGEDARLVPFSAQNNLVKNEVVLLPSEPRIYGSEERLVSHIQQFIHRHVDLGPSFEKVATYYVLLSWLYDAFNDLPYLRLRGDYGSGKTRALLTIGASRQALIPPCQGGVCNDHSSGEHDAHRYDHRSETMRQLSPSRKRRSIYRQGQSPTGTTAAVRHRSSTLIGQELGTRAGFRVIFQITH